MTSDGQVACFRVDEPEAGMKWSASIPGVWREELPYLVVRYKAENVATEIYLRLMTLEVDGQPVPDNHLEPIAEGDDSDSARFRWYRVRSVDGLRLGLDLRTENSRELSVVARLENDSSIQHTVSLVAPWIEGYRLADRPEDAYYLVPRRGAVFNNAACNYRERYCGLFPLQFLDTFNPTAGRGLALRTSDRS